MRGLEPIATVPFCSYPVPAAAVKPSILPALDGGSSRLHKAGAKKALTRVA